MARIQPRGQHVKTVFRCVAGQLEIDDGSDRGHDVRQAGDL